MACRELGEASHYGYFHLPSETTESLSRTSWFFYSPGIQNSLLCIIIGLLTLQSRKQRCMTESNLFDISLAGSAMWRHSLKESSGLDFALFSKGKLPQPGIENPQSTRCERANWAYLLRFYAKPFEPCAHYVNIRGTGQPDQGGK